MKKRKEEKENIRVRVGEWDVMGVLELTLAP
jgi:hypothetical protein